MDLNIFYISNQTMISLIERSSSETFVHRSDAEKCVSPPYLCAWDVHVYTVHVQATQSQRSKRRALQLHASVTSISAIIQIKPSVSVLGMGNLKAWMCVPVSSREGVSFVTTTQSQVQYQPVAERDIWSPC